MIDIDWGVNLVGIAVLYMVMAMGRGGLGYA